MRTKMMVCPSFSHTGKIISFSTAVLSALDGHTCNRMDPTRKQSSDRRHAHRTFHSIGIATNDSQPLKMQLESFQGARTVHHYVFDCEDDEVIGTSKLNERADTHVCNEAQNADNCGGARIQTAQLPREVPREREAGSYHFVLFDDIQ